MASNQEAGSRDCPADTAEYPGQERPQSQQALRAFQLRKRKSGTELLFQQLVDLSRVCLATGCFHHLPDQRIEGFCLAGMEFINRFLVVCKAGFRKRSA